MKTQYINLYDLLSFTSVTGVKVKQKLAFLVAKRFGKRFAEDVFFGVCSNIENNLTCKYSWSAFEFKFERSEVYRCIYTIIKDNSYYALDMSENSFVSELLSYEMSALCEAVSIDAGVSEALCRFKESKCKIVGVIDSCYSMSFVTELLNRLNISEFFDTVVTSQALIQAHFNGNFSDYFKTNVNALPRSCKKEDKLKKSIDKALNDIFRQGKKNTVFANYAFPLYLFVSRLYDELRKKNYNKVYFFAREGKFLKKIFDTYSSFQHNEIKSYYLEVSRNSLLIPSLAPIGEENFSEVVKGNCRISVTDFLTTLTFTADEIAMVVDKLKLNSYEKLPLFTHSSQFEELTQNIDFLRLYEEKRTTQYQNIIAYLSQFGIDKNVHSLAVVDVGWGGTMQNCLKKIFQTVTIDGFYLGVTIDSNVFISGNRKHGILFKEIPFKVTTLEKLFRLNMFDYEIILKADTPKTQGYVLSGDSVAPFYEESTEIQTYFCYIKPIQDTLEESFNKIARLYENCSYFDYKDMSIAKYTFKLALSMGYGATNYRNEVRKKHVEGFGNCGEIYKNKKGGLKDLLILYRSKFIALGLYLNYIKEQKYADRTLSYKLR